MNAATPPQKPLDVSAFLFLSFFVFPSSFPFFGGALIRRLTPAIGTAMSSLDAVWQEVQASFVVCPGQTLALNVSG